MQEVCLRNGVERMSSLYIQELELNLHPVTKIQEELEEGRSRISAHEY
jgi:hypothetical protein